MSPQTPAPIDVEKSTAVGKLPDSWLEVAGIHLTAEHLQKLNSVAWVDDLIISAAQNLLKIQNPHIGSLQFPLLANTMALEPQGGEFIQILNINGNHWITISSIGCEPGHINVYDSLHTNRLPADTKKVVADLLHLMLGLRTLFENFFQNNWLTYEKRIIPE